ncbi:MAG: hypothetical protein HY293_01145 [Planctomycetes bacterium]|nr:hypothetical protein [Planctomycetota bacterium]
MSRNRSILALIAALGAGCGPSEEPQPPPRTSPTLAVRQVTLPDRPTTRYLPAPEDPKPPFAMAPVRSAPRPAPPPLRPPEKSALHASWSSTPLEAAAQKGLAWLVSVQGEDGGWGQDGGKVADQRKQERLESEGNDVANTSFACLALLRSGTTPRGGRHRDALRKGIAFVLRHVEGSKAEGLDVTPQQGTQIQRKLGPYIDTFVSTLLLSEIDGGMADAATQNRVRSCLEKCVAKIQAHQDKDGSWNAAGGWAPLIGTSIAARALHGARRTGVEVESSVVERASDFAMSDHAESPGDAASFLAYSGGGRSGSRFGGKAGAAGVPLYDAAQALEAATRSAPAAGKPTLQVIKAATDRATRDTAFLKGFGSLGGEEFISYLNISDALVRDPGREWREWNEKIKEKLGSLQNADGTWAGHHCITGRVACTSAAVMTLLAERLAARPQP